MSLGEFAAFLVRLAAAIGSGFCAIVYAIGGAAILVGGGSAGQGWRFVLVGLLCARVCAWVLREDTDVRR